MDARPDALHVRAQIGADARAGMSDLQPEKFAGASKSMGRACAAQIFARLEALPKEEEP